MVHTAAALGVEEDHHIAAVLGVGEDRRIAAVLEAGEDHRIAVGEVEGRPIGESHVSQAHEGRKHHMSSRT